MKHITLLILILSSYVNATEQYREILEVDGYPFEFNQLPLEGFITQEKFNELYKPPICSAAWRGYRGHWMIVGNILYLRYLERGPCEDIPESIDLSKMFKGQEYNIEASWYTGNIILPIGPREFTYNGDDPRTVEYQAVVYKIEKGVVRGRIIERIKE